LLLLLSFQTSFSQTKEILGDTTYWYKNNAELHKTLDLKDFEKSTDEFNFRFRNHGQVIEISKDSSNYSGKIINYIFHTKRSNKNEFKILSNKIDLSSKQTKEIYNIIKNSKIIDLPTDEKTENWKQGTDGITYLFEYSDKKKYWLKTYWTPTSQDSISEAVIILDLITDSLNLQETYLSFKNTLPKKGCYNSGGIVNMCYASNSLEFGYSGATKFPFGFYSSYSANYIGKSKINSGVALQYNFDNNGFHHLNLQFSKWKIFFKESNLSDFLAYNYQNRIINFQDSKNKLENHQFKYGLNLKHNIGIGLGLDYLTRGYNKIGGNLYAYKWFSKPNVSTTLTTSIFENQINYKAEIFKSFNINSKLPIHRFDFGITYENFMNYKDLYFNIRVSI